MRKLFLFTLLNVLLSALIAVRYFMVPGASVTLYGSAFSFLAVPAHFFSLYLILFLICTPLLWVNKYVRYSLLAILFGFAQIALYVDTIVFEQYRFHINESVLMMVLFGQVVDFSFATYLLMGAIIIGVFAAEYLAAWKIDRKPTQQIRPGAAKSRTLLTTSLFLVGALLVSNIGYMIAFYYAWSPVMVVKEYLPLYYPLTSKKVMGFFDKNGQRRNLLANPDDRQHIRYPLRELVINPQNKKPANIMFIVIDSWRFDTFNEAVSPNTWNFVKQHNGVAFNNHYSTGNATRTGIFGLFYGIPGTWWQPFLNNSIPSLFVTTMQKEDYNIGIFTSAKVTFPEFDRTVFATIKNLRINSEGKSTPERDARLTKDWREWYQKRDASRPTFSFLFYDSAHAYDFPKDEPLKFGPVSDLNYMTLKNDTDPTPLFNRYKQSVYYIDRLLQQVYDQLAASGSLDDTLIILTGDHAQEMNDNKMGFWGHNGNFTDAQTKVPFIIVGAKNDRWLRENASKLTSHEDVVPSLMKHYLHVDNDTRDYATGYDLFSQMPDRKWLLMSSYSAYAIRTPENIYTVNGVGMSHYLDSHNRQVSGQPDYSYVYEAMNEMKYFVDQGDKKAQ
jgi:membrane-anchored protein YejM (alkaline phosphatase superfamily)